MMTIAYSTPQRAARFSALALATLVLTAAPASGARQAAGPSAGQPARQATVSAADAPVMWGADAVVYRPGGVSLEGRAEILQGENRLRADRLEVVVNDGNAVTRIEASGQVFYVTPRETMRGERAVYTPADDTVVITGEVILTQGDNVMAGRRLTYNLRTAVARMDAGSGGRVQGVFSSARD